MAEPFIIIAGYFLYHISDISQRVKCYYICWLFFYYEHDDNFEIVDDKQNKNEIELEENNSWLLEDN